MFNLPRRCPSLIKTTFFSHHPAGQNKSTPPCPKICAPEAHGPGSPRLPWRRRLTHHHQDLSESPQATPDRSPLLRRCLFCWPRKKSFGVRGGTGKRNTHQIYKCFFLSRFLSFTPPPQTKRGECKQQKVHDVVECGWCGWLELDWLVIQMNGAGSFWKRRWILEMRMFRFSLHQWCSASMMAFFGWVCWLVKNWGFVISDANFINPKIEGYSRSSPPYVNPRCIHAAR